MYIYPNAYYCVLFGSSFMVGVN